MKQIDILIKNATVMTMNSEKEIIDEGFVAIEGTNIIDVGIKGEILDNYKAEVVIDAKGNPVLPGFVNTHHHFFPPTSVDPPICMGKATCTISFGISTLLV